MNPELTTSLNHCLEESRKMRDAARALGTGWPGFGPILKLCNEFESDCRQIAQNRGFEDATIAFVGPKNAGKGTLTRELILSPDKRARIRVGGDHKNGTRKLTWISPRQPEKFDEQCEEHIPCHPDELERLGGGYQLLDVPGLDERSESVRLTAVRALRSAQIIVIVAQAWQLEKHRILEDIEPASGCILVPVVTQVTAETKRQDLDQWEELLRADFGPENSLRRIEVAHFRDRDSQSEEAIVAQARGELCERLMAAMVKRPVQEIAADRLSRRGKRFHQEIREAAAKHLPRANEQLCELDAHLRGLPAQALNDLLGDHRALAAGVRSRFHALLIERTPRVFFPWRLALSIAYWVSGAIDRVPLALAGSLPSLATIAFNVGRNIRHRLKFAQAAEAGFRKRIPALFQEMAAPQLADLGNALREDLREPNAAPVAAKVELRGQEILQFESKRLFRELFNKDDKPAPSESQTEIRTVGVWTARGLGLAGFGLFWAIMGMPFYGLYRDFFGAARLVLLERAATLGNFPEGTASMLCTSLLLALLPMCIFLLLSVAWITRRHCVDIAVTQIRERHRCLLAKLTAENGVQGRGILTVEFSEPRLDACRCLLQSVA
jgi:hypothetical protein